MECGNLSPLLEALTSQRTPKKDEAAEPSREALAAFGFCKAARAAWLPGYRRHVRLGLRLFDRRVLFLNQRFEDSLVFFDLFYVSSNN
jgi:hypothetical protein